MMDPDSQNPQPERIQSVIGRSPWFAGLSDVALEELAAAADFVYLSPGYYVYEQGQPTKRVYGLVDGRVRVSLQSPNGKEFALIDREAGSWLGEPGLVSDEGRIIEAVVIDPTLAVVIPCETVIDVADRYPQVYRNLFHYSQGVLRGMHELVAGILFYPLKARVAGRLLHLCQEHGAPSNSGVLLQVKVSQNEFARLALGSRQRVNGVFREWTERGLVRLVDDHLWIRDLEELEQEIALFD